MPTQRLPAVSQKRGYIAPEMRRVGKEQWSPAGAYLGFAALQSPVKTSSSVVAIDRRAGKRRHHCLIGFYASVLRYSLKWRCSGSRKAGIISLHFKALYATAAWSRLWKSSSSGNQATSHRLSPQVDTSTNALFMFRSAQLSPGDSRGWNGKTLALSSPVKEYTWA